MVHGEELWVQWKENCEFTGGGNVDSREMGTVIKREAELWLSREG